MCYNNDMRSESQKQADRKYTLKHPGRREQADRRCRLKHMHPCLDCGKPIHAKSTRCGSCATKHSQTWLKYEHASGERHPSWKGGRFHQKSGYVFVMSPSHPRANKGGYVPEHILVWEEAHNHPLPENWIIHHINGIKGDNRPKNLLAMPRQGHSPSLTVKEVQKRLREVEAELSQQSFC